ncbi:MAG: folylpolyglutamate synthase/dihydrofolate synthase family protein [Bacteroidales bacterium]|nr:folylpolyglutamate synthase/dihydrofolate synthase family protein [Bacteroidales bacterium]
MNYQETLDYLYSYLPMFQRIGAAAYKEDIYNTVELMKALGNPEKKFKSIHVAGTNGKGSSSHLIASILREKGLKVGLHTSPHLKDFRERIKINNQMCEEDFVVKFVENNKELIERIKPSFFETAVAMAFTYFAQENVDVAIIEVGMGGRLDSTNIINPLACLITNISFDHTQFLGNSLEAIAQEKAGIIKQNTPVVISQTQKETQNVFSAKANEKNSPICFADSYLSCENVNHSQGLLKMDIYKNGVERIKNLQSSLSGYYQQKNILGVVALIDTLNQYHNFNISDEEIKQGIENLSSNFPIAGRWQTLCNKPLTICDTGHNEDGLKYVIEQIKNTPHEKLRFVLAMVNDKDVNKVLSMLDKDAEYYLSQAKIPRALPVDELAEKAQQAGLSFTKYATISQALAQAQQDSKENDLVFVGGSTFTVAEVV